MKDVVTPGMTAEQIKAARLAAFKRPTADKDRKVKQKERMTGLLKGAGVSVSDIQK